MKEVPESTYKLQKQCLVLSIILLVIVLISSPYDTFEKILGIVPFAVVIYIDIMYVKIQLKPEQEEEQ